MFNGYETEELVRDHIRALLRELEVAERTGNGARADLVRAQLRAFGHKAEAPAKRAEKRPASRASTGKAERR
jgi:hypothetical protein